MPHATCSQAPVVSGNADPENSLSLTGKKWSFPNLDERKVRYLAQTYALEDSVAQILAHRMASLEDIQGFLNPVLKTQLPDPALLPDMEPAVARVLKALEQKEKIAIWGDYDVDGATSSAILAQFFKAIGVDVQIYIPDRFREGYGPNIQGFQELQQKGVSLIITVDCGTTATSVLQEAQDMGLDVIVVDHHGTGASLPTCCALINPKRLDAQADMRPFETLAAVGLCFLFIVALNRALRDRAFYTEHCPEPQLLAWLDLVALGTVCDVMPLIGLNRVFVSQGLKVFGQRQNLGLKTLGEVAGLKEHPSASHLGFLFGPRINAGGRVGEASLGTRLLMTNDPADALTLACQLNHLNQERQRIEIDLEAQALLQAEAQKNQSVIVVADTGWHTGVIGIVAGRLKDRFYRPTFVVGFENGLGKGSARSIPGFDVGAVIQQALDLGLLKEGGGHPMAGGFAIWAEKLPQFQEFLKNVTTAFFKESQRTPTLTIEGVLTLNALTPQTIQAFEALAPYGTGNPQPRFLFRQVRITSAMWVGAQHARITLTEIGGAALQAMVFRCAGTALGDFLFTSCVKGCVDVVGTVSLDHWGGRVKPRLIIEDIGSC